MLPERREYDCGVDVRIVTSPILEHVRLSHAPVQMYARTRVAVMVRPYGTVAPSSRD